MWKLKPLRSVTTSQCSPCGWRTARFSVKLLCINILATLLQLLWVLTSQIILWGVSVEPLFVYSAGITNLSVSPNYLFSLLKVFLAAISACACSLYSNKSVKLWFCLFWVLLQSPLCFVFNSISDCWVRVYFIYLVLFIVGPREQLHRHSWHPSISLNCLSNSGSREGWSLFLLSWDKR